jgi:type I restriction enzyme S subunit
MLSKKISAISKRVSSGLTPLRSNPEFWLDGTIPWLKTEQLGEKYIFTTTEKISEAALRETSVKIYPPNTLSVAMYGEGKTRGNVSIIKSAMATNQACCNIEIDPELADFEYVYYFLKTQYNELRNLSSGVRKNLNSEDIKNFVIRLPNDLADQRKIASILSSLDAKIECNNRISWKLESLTKLLYDYWFVQFDFPDSKGNPYKSSGGAMLYNDVLKRQIPDGWEVKKIGEYADVTKGDLITAKDAHDGEIKVVAAGIDYSYKHASFNRPENTITISGSGANAGYINFWREPIFASDCITVRGKTDCETILLLQYLRFIQPYIFSQATGSAQPHVYPSDIKNLDYVMADNELIKRFGELVVPINNVLTKNTKENDQLARLRDWLLPMLMNGQVTPA